ncbi:MAG: SusD/RagB family nutrient-binding outer membrane lipoprotein [Candidatus Symbiothrix sp.]|nr:SusD/RagB family nutrient-binding outer membrane lipoprotein [Candidatus Symbiothrix sp.]
MKKIVRTITVGLTLTGIVLLNACTDKFDEINTRTDRLTSVSPELIFGLSPVVTLRELTSNNNWYFFGNYGNQWSVIGGTGPHFGFDGRGERIWNNLYSGGLLPLYEIIANYGDNPVYANRVAIAKIWKAYIFSQLTAIYGPCPYTDACNGRESISFDNEETVYRGILKELKDAYTAINTATSATDNYPAKGDPFIGGQLGTTAQFTDLNRWAQFARCIRLRTAIRLTEVPDAWASGLAQEAKAIVAEELDNAENGLLINDNTGNFWMQFGAEADRTNPLYQEVIGNPELLIVDPGNFPVLHESLSLWIKEETYKDPCLDVMCTAGSGGSGRNRFSKWLGRPHSMERPENYQEPQGYSSPYNNLKYADFATVGKTFSGVDAKFYFFSYPELCFIRAEATYKGYWTKGKTAEEYYYEGIDARCTKYSKTGAAVTTYKNQAGIKWSTPSDTVRVGSTIKSTNYRDYLGGFIDSYLGGEEDNLKRIIVQHWISLFSQNIDIWTLLRRTEVIPFKPHFGVDLNNGYVNSRWGYTPERMIYPGNERIINKTETFNAIDNYLLDKGNAPKGQQDQVTYRLIFAKDNPGLPVPVPGTVAYAAYPYPLENMSKNRVENNPFVNFK